MGRGRKGTGGRTSKAGELVSMDPAIFARGMVDTDLLVQRYGYKPGQAKIKVGDTIYNLARTYEIPGEELRGGEPLRGDMYTQEGRPEKRVIISN